LRKWPGSAAATAVEGRGRRCCYSMSATTRWRGGTVAAGSAQEGIGATREASGLAAMSPGEPAASPLMQADF